MLQDYCLPDDRRATYLQAVQDLNTYWGSHLTPRKALESLAGKLSVLAGCVCGAISKSHLLDSMYPNPLALAISNTVTVSGGGGDRSRRLGAR
jgi:hypothetical protein